MCRKENWALLLLGMLWSFCFQCWLLLHQKMSTSPKIHSTCTLQEDCVTFTLSLLKHLHEYLPTLRVTLCYHRNPGVFCCANTDDVCFYRSLFLHKHPVRHIQVSTLYSGQKKKQVICVVVWHDIKSEQTDDFWEMSSRYQVLSVTQLKPNITL